MMGFRTGLLADVIADVERTIMALGYLSVHSHSAACWFLQPGRYLVRTSCTGIVAIQDASWFGRTVKEGTHSLLKDNCLDVLNSWYVKFSLRITTFSYDAPAAFGPPLGRGGWCSVVKYRTPPG
ncbi:hypothetical protein PAXRUDRAFT_609391 [Paxillus rubicundulus Ve08.2h10]|uniref:Uncharacterized protein n=1 Tax=Paxillus rubicundulus Ve08.2h10 TaxID=930991 RepID=A0A0D0EC92_9AGAM|nr:hypothetical protein PAXRUDRAFT_609391 [Paxillus rubicundulus Ve08.2h10]